jgi:hypothetical protein
MPQEGRAAGMLNHSDILAVYDAGPLSGQSFTTRSQRLERSTDGAHHQWYCRQSPKTA